MLCTETVSGNVLQGHFLFLYFKNIMRDRALSLSLSQISASNPTKEVYVLPFEEKMRVLLPPLPTGLKCRNLHIRQLKF